MIKIIFGKNRRGQCCEQISRFFSGHGQGLTHPESLGA